MITIPTTSAQGILQDAIGATTVAFLGDLQFHLYQNALVITPAVTLAALTEATFGGYSGSNTFAMSGSLKDPAGNGIVSGAGLTETCNSTTTTNTIYGMYATGTGSDSATLKYVDSAPSPIQINGVGDYVQYGPVFGIPGPVQGLWGGP